jgi:hypothetical protein
MAEATGFEQREIKAREAAAFHRLHRHILGFLCEPRLQEPVPPVWKVMKTFDG